MFSRCLKYILLAVLALSSLNVFGQVDSSSDAGHAATQLGAYETLDLSNLYMGIQVPILLKEGSKALPFSYSIVGFPNVMPGVWGQTSSDLSIPWPLFGGIGYSVSPILCASGSSHVWTAGYSAFTYVDGAGALNSFTVPVSSSGTLGCASTSAVSRTASGLLTISVIVNANFLMTYTVTDANGTQIVPSSIGGGFLKTGWTASTNLGLNAFLYDTNGNAQLTTACNNFTCTSGTTQPTYNSNYLGTTTDGNLTWTNYGKPAGKVTDVSGNSILVAVTNLTGATQTGGGSFADASPDYSKPQVWTYTDTMNMNALTVTNPALTDSHGNNLSTVQTAMTYKDNMGNTQNAYLNQSFQPMSKLNAPCLGSLSGPAILGVNATIDGGGTIHGTSLANPTSHTFFPTSLVYPDSSRIGFQYEQLSGSPSGNTTVTNVGIVSDLVTLQLANAPALGASSPITKLVASGGTGNGTITATISGTNPWSVNMTGTIAFMSSQNMVWDGLPFTVLSNTSNTITFAANYCQFFITCPSTLTVNESQGYLISNYTTLSLSGLTGATFLNGTSPTYYTIGGSPFNVYYVSVTSGVAYFHYKFRGFASQPTPTGQVVMSNMLNSHFNVTGTINSIGSDGYGPYYTLSSGTFTNGTYNEQGVGMSTAATGTNFITYYVTHANYGPASDSGTLANAGASATTSGRLSQLTLPTGGTIYYTYSGGTNNSGINCQDASYATVTRQTPDGTTTYTHTPSSWTTSIPIANYGTAFEIYNWAGLWGYGFTTGLNDYQPYYYLFPVVQADVTNIQVTGTLDNYTITATFTNPLPSLVPGNPVYIYAPASTLKLDFLANVVSVVGNTLTTDAGNYATGTFNGPAPGFITTAYPYGGEYPYYSMFSGTWATFNTGGPNSTTSVIDPAGNETLYQFAGLRQVDRKVFNGTPANATLNPSFENGLTHWSAISPMHDTESGSVTCGEGNTWSTCATFLDTGATGSLSDPWTVNSSTGIASLGLGTAGTGGCCQNGPQNNNYGAVMNFISSSGSSYTGYMAVTPPSQFQVGSNITIANGSGGSLPNNVTGTFPITAVCPTCSPATVTWTNSSHPSLCPLTTAASVVQSLDGSNQLDLQLNASVPNGSYIIQGTEEPDANNRVAYNSYGGGFYGYFAGFWGQPSYSSHSDTGTVSTSACAVGASGTVTVFGPYQGGYANVQFSSVTSTGSAPATYTAITTTTPPSGFTVGAPMGVAVTGSDPGVSALQVSQYCGSLGAICGVPITAVTSNSISWQFPYGPLDCTPATCSGGSANVIFAGQVQETAWVSSVQNVQINGVWTTVVTLNGAYPNIEVGPHGTQFVFAGFTYATFLNGQTLTPNAWDGQANLYFTPPSGAPEPYGPTSEPFDKAYGLYYQGDPGSRLYSSDQLLVSNMTVPNVNYGDTITGITFSVNVEPTSATANATLQAQISNNGVLIGTPKTCTVTTAATTCNFGSSTDMWGISSLTYGSSFGVSLSLSTTGTGGPTYTICCGGTGNTGFSLTLNAIPQVLPPLWTTTNSQFYQGAKSATVSSIYEAQLFSLNSAGSQYQAVNPGDIITFGGYLLRSGGFGNVWITCQFFDSTQTFISQCPYAGPVPQSAIGGASQYTGSLLPLTWTYYNSTVVAPSNAAYVTIYVELHGSGNSNDSGGDSDSSLTTVFADVMNFTDLTTSGLLSEDITCYNSKTLYVSGSANTPQYCLTLPPVAMNAPITEVDTYSYRTGDSNYSSSSQAFDSEGRLTDTKTWNGGQTQSNFNLDVAMTYGTYTGALTTSANPSNCSALANPALTRTLCYQAMKDSAGNVLGEEIFQYDANGNALKKNLIDVPDVKNFVMSYSYSTNGQLATVTEPNGLVTTLNNTLCNGLLPSKIYDSFGSQSFTVDCSTGNALTVTDSNSNVWTNIYNNPMNRLTGVKTPMTTTSYTDGVTFTYGANSFDSKITYNSGNSVNENLQTFDSLGRLLLSQQAFSSSQFSTMQFGYNSLGLISSQSVPFLSAAGTTGTGLTTSSLTYDALQRHVKDTSTDGQIVQYQYNGMDTLTTTGSTKAQVETDELGYVVSVCEINSYAGNGLCPQQTSQTGFYTTFTNDVLGRITQMVNNAQSSSPQTTSIVYDGFGRITSITRPETGQLKYTWDSDPAGECSASAGNVVRLDDAGGNTTCATYDLANRQTSETYYGPYAAVTPSKYFVYDTTTTFSCPNPANQNGRLAEIYTGSSSAKTTDEVFCYSPRGELTDVFEVTPNSGGYYHTSVTYWPDGSLNTLSGVPGVAGSFTYTPGYSWINKVTGPSSANLVTGVTSTTGVIPNVVTYGSGDLDTFSLNSTGKFSGYSASIGGSTASGSWTWNTNGYPSTLALTNPFDSTAPSQSCAYTWDTLQRVTAFKCTNGTTKYWGQTFTYDQFGNVKKNIPSGFTGQKWAPTYNLANNQYSGSAYSYDASGRLLKDSINTYTWTVDGKIATLTNVASGVVTTYTYNGTGTLVEESSSNVSGHIQYVQSPIGKVAATHSTN